MLGWEQFSFLQPRLLWLRQCPHCIKLWFHWFPHRKTCLWNAYYDCFYSLSIIYVCSWGFATDPIFFACGLFWIFVPILNCFYLHSTAWCSRWLCINCENASTMVKNSWNGSDICRFFHKIRSWWFGTLTLLRCNIGGREMEGAERIYLNISLIMTLKFTKEPQFIKPVFTMNLKLSHPALPGLEKIPRNL